MVEIFSANKDKIAAAIGVATGITTGLIGGTPDTVIQMAVGGYVSGRLFVESAQSFLDTITADNTQITRPLLHSLKTGLYFITGSAVAGGWTAFTMSHDLTETTRVAASSGALVSFFAAGVLGPSVFVSNGVWQSSKRDLL